MNQRPAQERRVPAPCGHSGVAGVEYHERLEGAAVPDLLSALAHSVRVDHGRRVGQAEQTALYAAHTTWCQNEGALVMSSCAFASRTRELVGLASPKGMILSNQRKYYPGIGLLTDEERDTGA